MNCYRESPRPAPQSASRGTRDWPKTTVLANFVRITYEADVIVVGEFVRRRTPPEPPEVEGD